MRTGSRIGPKQEGMRELNKYLSGVQEVQSLDEMG